MKDKKWAKGLLEGGKQWQVWAREKPKEKAASSRRETTIGRKITTFLCVTRATFPSKSCSLQELSLSLLLLLILSYYTYCACYQQRSMLLVARLCLRPCVFSAAGGSCSSWRQAVDCVVCNELGHLQTKRLAATNLGRKLGHAPKSSQGKPFRKLGVCLGVVCACVLVSVCLFVRGPTERGKKSTKVAPFCSARLERDNQFDLLPPHAVAPNCVACGADGEPSTTGHNKGKEIVPIVERALFGVKKMAAICIGKENGANRVWLSASPLLLQSVLRSFHNSLAHKAERIRRPHETGPYLSLRATLFGSARTARFSRESIVRSCNVLVQKRAARFLELSLRT